MTLTYSQLTLNIISNFMHSHENSCFQHRPFKLLPHRYNSIIFTWKWIFVNSISPWGVIGYVINFLLLGVERFTFTWLLYFVIATTHMVAFLRKFYDPPEVKLPFITLSLHTSLINFLFLLYSHHKRKMNFQ